MSLDFSSSLDAVFARVAQPANYDRWLLALVNETGTGLDTVIDHSRRNSGAFRPARLFRPCDQQDADCAHLYDAERMLLNSPTAFPNYDQLSPRQQEALGKTMLMPILLGDEAIGVLLVGNRVTPPISTRTTSS